MPRCSPPPSSPPVASAGRRRRRPAQGLRPALPEWLRIVRDVDDTTEMDRATGAVRSVQSAEVVLPAERIDAMWSPQYLERLARTYWRFLTRATLGVIRVKYTEGERYVCLLFRPLELLPSRRPSTRWTTPRHRALAHRARAARRRPRPRRRRLPGDRRRAPPAPTSPALVNVPSRSRWPTSTPPSRRAWPLRLHQHAVAHPRDRHPRLPALAGTAGLRGVAGRALRDRRRGARPVHAAAERAQRHQPGFVTFARARRSWSCSLAPSSVPSRRRTARHRGPRAASADTLVTPAPGAGAT